VAPVKQAVTLVEHRVQGAQNAAKKLADECATKSAGWQDAYTQLTNELNAAYAGLAGAQDLADELQKQNDGVILQANEVVADRNKLQSQIEPLKESRHRWVKYFWYSAALSIAAVAWIFKKPLMLLTGIGI
jgi:chromosome segregation ATPase